ncbi:MAG: glycogen debranching N-terminal domain-containing protein [Acidimicrobiales bacterium]
MSQDPSPFAGTTPVASLRGAGGAVTLVAGQTFCVSAETGDIVTDLPHGLFVLDTRVLSDWELRVNGHTIEPLAVDVTEPFSATFVGHARPAAGRADADIVLFRCRSIGSGMREQVTVTNHGLSEAPVVVELICGVDFADLFEVKESRVRERGEHGHEVSEERLRYTHRDGTQTKAVTLRTHDAASVEPGHITWRTVLGHGQTWEICVELTVGIDDRDLEARFRCGGADEEALPVRRMQSWRAILPGVETDHQRLASAVQRAGEDLGALRIFDPDHPDVPILAAGAPWFMTVFGRDSLLTAWMTLIADSSLAEGVLLTLARFQGSKVDAATEEEPGKILHEMRFGSGGSLSRGGSNTYYGSIDATPLFVMLLGELGRWDPDSEAVSELLPHADRALEWIERFGDRDEDGYVEYQRQSDDGLVNQGWKDSWDAVRHLDGELATGPIALCEVQGYVYGAYLARAHLALAAGDVATFDRYRDRAAALRRRFNEDFWLEEHGWYALGLDGDKRPIETLASNIGHCLWTGIVDPDRADAVVAHLMSEEMFSGWGIRTLATSMKAYNPVSYHNGSVWPHDNALCIAGLARYGYLDDAHRVIDGQLAAADAHDGRLPELFAGFHRERPRTPAAYPTSCSPQAWAAAAPLLWLRAMLRLDPWAPGGEVALEPALPSWLHRLHVDGITVAGQHLSVEVEGGQVSVAGEGPLRLVRRARAPQWQPDASTWTQ